MTDFVVPIPVYVAVGVIVLWSKTSKTQRNVYGLTAVVEMVFASEKVRGFVELIVFLSIGCIISHGIVAPTTPAQAVAAGLGWTGLMTK
jgi:hypothetical protein